MNAEHDLNLQIITLTVRIQQLYPELYRDLNEMHATLPTVAVPVINTMVLSKWYESLLALVNQYDSVQSSSNFS